MKKNITIFILLLSSSSFAQDLIIAEVPKNVWIEKDLVTIDFTNIIDYQDPDQKYCKYEKKLSSFRPGEYIVLPCTPSSIVWAVRTVDKNQNEIIRAILLQYTLKTTDNFVADDPKIQTVFKSTSTENSDNDIQVHYIESFRRVARHWNLNKKTNKVETSDHFHLNVDYLHDGKTFCSINRDIITKDDKMSVELVPCGQDSSYVVFMGLTRKSDRSIELQNSFYQMAITDEAKIPQKKGEKNRDEKSREDING